MNNIQSWFQFFEKLGDKYISTFMSPLWNKEYINHDRNLEDSLCLFIKGYAFERNLNPAVRQEWAKTGVNAIKEAFRNFNGRWNSQIVTMVWEYFIDTVTSPNPKVNPLAPLRTEYREEDRIKFTNQISFLQAINCIPQIISTSFTDFIINQIKQDNLLLVYGLLIQVNGISDKIATFFLRDILEYKKIQIYPDERELLAHPIDRHVREIVNIIIQSRPLQLQSDIEFKIFIINNARSFKLNPRKINMGIWFFGSQILRGGMRNFPNSVKEAQELVNKYNNSNSA